MKNLILFGQTEILIIVITVIVLVLGFFLNFYLKGLRAKKIKETLLACSKEYGFELLEFNKNIADFALEKEGFRLLIKLAYVPSNSSITINSKNTWNLRYGGSGTYGKSYSNKRYLTELVPFLEYEASSEKKVQKVIVVYPRTNKLEKHLNESDIAIISYKDISYGYKVINFNDFEKHFEDLL